MSRYFLLSSLPTKDNIVFWIMLVPSSSHIMSTPSKVFDITAVSNQPRYLLSSRLHSFVTQSPQGVTDREGIVENTERNNFNRSETVIFTFHSVNESHGQPTKMEIPEIHSSKLHSEKGSGICILFLNVPDADDSWITLLKTLVQEVEERETYRLQ